MSRKRTHESLERRLARSCEICGGKGTTKSASTICYEILRQIRREGGALAGDVIAVQAHPSVAELMNGAERAAVDDTVKRVQKAIEISGRKGYHPEKFDVRGRKPKKNADDASA